MNDHSDISSQSQRIDELDLLLKGVVDGSGINQNLIDQTTEDDSQLGQQLAAFKRTVDILKRVSAFDAAAECTMNGSGTLITDGQMEPPSTTAVDDVLDAPCRHFGRFELVHLLGHGGFGIVYLARDPKLKRAVALKVPRTDALMIEEVRQRFLHEAEAAAALNHPNIVPVYEIGDVGGVAYIASEYCDGPTLEQWLADHQPNNRQSAELARSIADALQHAHSRNVLHRDLKPQNILLVTDDSGEVCSSDSHIPASAKITDFGLAKIQTDDSNVTRTGSIIGTPSYIAPEQAAGREGAASQQSDIYSIGATLYRMLTGQPPFKEATPLATLRAVQEQEPEPPSRLNPEIDPDLEAICMKCLERVPRHRYSSAADLRTDLDNYLSGCPVAARPVNSVQKLVRWCQRQPALAVSTGALCIVVLTALFAGWILLIDTAVHRRLAEQRGIDLQQEVVAKDDALHSAKRMADELKSAIDDLFTAIATTPEIQLPGTESLRSNLLVQISKHYDRLRLQTPTNKQLRQSFVATVNRIASLNNLLGDHVSAMENAEFAIQVTQQFPAESMGEYINIINSHLEAAQASAKLNDSVALRQFGARAIDAATKMKNLPDDQPHSLIRTAIACTSLGQIYASVDDWATANQYHRMAMDCWNEVNIESLNPMMARERVRSYLIAARSLAAVQRTGDAMEIMAFALPQAETMTCDRDNSPPGLLLEMAFAYRNSAFARISNLEECLPYLNKGIEVSSYLRDKHPLVPQYMDIYVALRYQYALAHFIAGDYESSGKVFRDAFGELAETVPHLLPDHGIASYR
ncbi:MAG: serine/threonine-protein kinase [Pirellulaceae bacterium]